MVLLAFPGRFNFEKEIMETEFKLVLELVYFRLCVDKKCQNLDF